MSDNYSLEADAKEIELEGVAFPVQGAVRYEVANVFARKVAQGDPGPDDHPINSTWIVTSNAGGGQIAEHNPSQDSGRFWWSTLDTTRPNAMTLPPLTYQYADPNASARSPIIIGDLQVSYSDLRFYVVWDTELFQWESSTDDFTSIGDLGAAPVAEGCAYQLASGANAGQIWLFIPCGTTYKTYYQPSGIAGAVGVGADGGALHFWTWNEKLFRLSQTGKLWRTTDGATWDQVGIVSDGSIPRRLTPGWSRENESLLYVVTDAGVYSYDDTLDVLRRTELVFPKHPRQGKASISHGGEGLFVSVGMGLHRMIGDTITSDQGLDRDHGLPDGYRGEIVSMASSYGVLYALVKGEEYSDAGSLIEGEEIFEIAPDPHEAPAYFGSTTNQNLLMAWNGRGWHYRWQEAGKNARNVMVSQAQDTYRVWWSANDYIYSQKLPLTFFNPRNATPEDGIEFAESGTYETGWYNWGWSGQQKILKRLEVSCRNMESGCSVAVAVKYDLDSNGWISVGTTTANGETGFPIGDPITDVGTVGTTHDRFKVRITITRDAVTTTQYPTVEWFAAIGRKWLRPQRSWRFMLDLTRPHKGRGPKEMADWLDILAGVRDTGDEDEPYIRRGVVFVHQDERYIVDLVGLNGNDDPDEGVWRNYRSVYLIESNEADVYGQTG